MNDVQVRDGYAIKVRSTDAYWLLYLHGADGARVYSAPLRVSRGLPLKQAYMFALEHWDLVPLTVTTDAAGYITSIEATE